MYLVGHFKTNFPEKSSKFQEARNMFGRFPRWKTTSKSKQSENNQGRSMI